MHIKPGVQLQGGHLIGFAADEPEKLAKTVLALMISPSMGKPSFVARLIPVYSLKADFLYDQIMLLLKIIHDASGYVYMVMSDNLKTNQSMFSKFHEHFESSSIFSIKHPIKNSEYTELFLLYDPTHLLKNVRNNWYTEKMQQLRYTDPESGTICVAQWADLISIYNKECQSLPTHTTLTYSALHPTNFEKQKVSLALQVFNEKTVTMLKIHGFKETARFCELVLRMWSCLNIKKS